MKLLSVIFCFHLKSKNNKMITNSFRTKLSSDKKSHFLNKSAVTKIVSPVCPACILFSIHLQQLKGEEVLLAFVEEQRNASQVGVRCVSQEVVHFA